MTDASQRPLHHLFPPMTRRGERRDQRSKRLRERRAYPRCEVTGKLRFRDHDDAISNLRNIRIIRGLAERHAVPTRRQETRVYRCQFCNGWHFTSQARLSRDPQITSRLVASRTPAESPAMQIASRLGA